MHAIKQIGLADRYMYIPVVCGRGVLKATGQNKQKRVTDRQKEREREKNVRVKQEREIERERDVK